MENVCRAPDYREFDILNVASRALPHLCLAVTWHRELWFRWRMTDWASTSLKTPSKVTLGPAEQRYAKAIASHVKALSLKVCFLGWITYF